MAPAYHVRKEIRRHGPIRPEGDGYTGGFEKGQRTGWGMLKTRQEQDVQIGLWQGGRHGQMLERIEGVESICGYQNDKRHGRLLRRTSEGLETENW